MELGLIVLGFVGVVLVFAFLHVLSKMASERESVARRKLAHAGLHCPATRSPTPAYS